MADGLEFLDLEGINDDDRKFLDEILFDRGGAVETAEVEKEERPETSNPEKSPSSQPPQVSDYANYAAGANPVVYINNVTANVNVHHPCPPSAKDEGPPAANPGPVVITRPPVAVPASPAAPIQNFGPHPAPNVGHSGYSIPPYVSHVNSVNTMNPGVGRSGGLYFPPNISFFPHNNSYLSVTIPPYPMAPLANPTPPPPAQSQRPAMTLIRTPTPPVSQQQILSQAQLAAMFLQQQQFLQQAQPHLQPPQLQAFQPLQSPQPSKPIQPPQPSQTQPCQPPQPQPCQPSQPQPCQPSQPQPCQPSQPQPCQPSQPQPCQPSQPQPCQPSQPSQLQSSTPSQLQTSQPSHLQPSQSSHPSQLQVSQPSHLQPSQSSHPSQLQPSQPSQLQPSQPSQLQTSHSSQLQPSKPFQSPQPFQPSQSSHPSQLQPSLKPSRPSQLQPSQPSQPFKPSQLQEPEEESDGEGIAFGTVDAETLNIALKKKKEVEEAKEDPPATMSWAKLFFQKEQTSMEGSKVQQKPTALIQPYNTKPQTPDTELTEGETENKVSPKDLALAEILKTWDPSHKSAAMKPRGLSNRSNWCFVNAILQALVACPPFFNLMKNLPKGLLEKPEAGDTKSCDMNILRAVHSFFSEFSALDNFPMKIRRDKKSKSEEVPQGKTLEPSTIYNVLLNLTSDTFKVAEGRQEDAEEFLTFLLNGLNDEMLSLFKTVEPEDEDLQEEDEDGDWQEVGPRNRSCVTRRPGLRSRLEKPPIANIFQGQVRSCVQISNGEHTATLQPFFTLQLDIQNANVANLNDALDSNFAVESLDGYLCSKTKQEIAASRSMSFEELPPILVLHLKRFVFGADGCQKLLKNIDFPVDLEIGRDILSPNSRGRYSARQRQYKLFAVVYHNGTEATKGHYIADIYHTGLSTWIRCDDSVLKPMSESMVMAHSASSVPYILFYRRCDTMIGNQQSASSNSQKQY